MLEANGLEPKEYSLVPAGGVLQRWQALLRGEHAGTSFAPAAAPDFEGIRTVLALRNQYASPHRMMGDAFAYVDLRYYLA